MKYFGTDGIRGVAYEYITHDMAYAVGRSLGLLEQKKVVVSRDTRESGHMIVKAIKEGIIDAGLEVLDLDIQSTPVLAFMSIREQCFGVMITASHNPYHDNGIKVFNKGIKTLPVEEQVIEDVIDQKVMLDRIPGGKELPYVDPLPLYYSLYQDFITPLPIKIALDLANGASIKAAKFIFHHVSEELEFIGDNPDGYNINKDVGSTHLNFIQNFIRQEKFDIGFAFDGDGDRVLTVDRDGSIIDGDLMIYIFACYLQEKGLLKNNTVVLTKMSNMGIVEALEKRGIEVIQTDIGDKYVVQAMKDNDLILGGENSGHVINHHLFISGDGVLNAAFLIKILADTNKTLQELVADVSFYPDRLYNLRNTDKSIAKDQRIIDLVETIQSELKGKGKVLVRPSGTEPIVRISASARTIEQVDSIIQRIVDKFTEISKEKE